jgi:GST-like protein
VDHAPAGGGAPLPVFESGAILLYLAEKIGLFLPTETTARVEVLEWLFWQVAGLGPMAGQAGHFHVFAPEKVPYAIERYTHEVARLYGVLDRRLDGREFIAGEFSIADIACYPWIVPHEAHGQNLADYPNLERWFIAISQRPATQRTYEGVDNAYKPKQPLSEEERRVLFGSSPKPNA